MENKEKRTKRLSLIWLILSQIVVVVSGMFWLVIWGMTFVPDGSALTIFSTSYPVLVIASIVMSWITFVKKRYVPMILWSVLPLTWWIVFFTL